MTGKTSKTYQPLIIVFIIITILILCFRAFLKSHSFDPDFLLVANLLLLVISFVAIFLQRKGLRSANNNFFIRTVYMAMIVKMFICMIAIFIYVFKNTSNVSMASIFTFMGIYFIYAAIEVTTLMKRTGKPNA